MGSFFGQQGSAFTRVAITNEASDAVVAAEPLRIPGKFDLIDREILFEGT
jgi:hypothetical protein